MNLRWLRRLPWRVVLPSLLIGSLIPIIILAILSLAETKRNVEYAGLYSIAPEAAMPEVPVMATAGAAPVWDESGGGAARELSSVSSQATTERLIIYDADMTLVVQDTDRALAEVESLAEELGGYVSSSNTQEYAEGSRASVVLRVPADQLDTAMNRLRGLALEVRQESRTGQDVTEEYVDLNARLKILQAAEQELLELYQKRQAEGEVDDILEVYRQLVSFRQEIESLTGRIQYLEQAAAMATITVTLIPDTLAQPVEFGGWRPEGTARAALQALIHILQTLADAVIWFFITIVPLAVIIGAPLYGLWRWIRHRRRNRAAVETAAEDHGE
ncbi:MAG TPA: DUF4349 domain-containing protein [Anaerolineae bacterium]|nr:DUF4349 domain-containing protein [Anaerolineae bacterium]